MHVYMYVCMYVYVHMNVCNVCMHVSLYEVCMKYVCVYMYVCMHVYTQLILSVYGLYMFVLSYLCIIIFIYLFLLVI